ncbi:hypothetical protein [Peribacillus butanolivorans]|uniref:hypothetical protein n=1 Tax=Peribacillus butanolivorans TaxID=421767 RepID=UPI001F356C78|nr:hypothetical protein [Peribacillus butanolivorans]
MLRLPVGMCDWAKIKNPSFIAEAIASPPLKSAEAIDNKSFRIHLIKIWVWSYFLVVKWN